MSRQVAIALVLAAVHTGLTVQTLNAQTRPDPKEIADALGVSVDTLQTCMAPIRNSGARPTRQQRIALLDCFQTANPDLTAAQLREVLSNARPS